MIVFKVYQWCDIEISQEYIDKQVEIENYNTLTEIKADERSLVWILYIRSNTDVKLGIKGFNKYNEYINIKDWCLYRTYPQYGWVPNDDKITWKPIVNPEESFEEDDLFYLNWDDQNLRYPNKDNNRFAVGMRLDLKPNFPAGSHTLEFYIYVFPTVTFPSG